MSQHCRQGVYLDAWRLWQDADSGVEGLDTASWEVCLVASECQTGWPDYYMVVPEALPNDLQAANMDIGGCSRMCFP